MDRVRAGGRDRAGPDGAVGRTGIPDIDRRAFTSHGQSQRLCQFLIAFPVRSGKVV